MNLDFLNATSSLSTTLSHEFISGDVLQLILSVIISGVILGLSLGLVYRVTWWIW